jgi:hypothetical protein
VQVGGNDAEPETPETAEDEETAAAVIEEEPETEPAPKVTTAAVQRTLDLSTVRWRQPRVLPELPAPGTSITARSTTPATRPGSP